MLNKDLYNLMNTKDSEELFSHYKHDGFVDFDKRLVAGKILFERGFDNARLKSEKQKILIDIYTTIENCSNVKDLLNKNRRKIRKQCSYKIGTLGFVLIFGLLSYFGIIKYISIPFNKVWILMAYVLFTLLAVLYTLRGRVMPKVDEEVQDARLLQKQISLINEYWQF